MSMLEGLLAIALLGLIGALSVRAKRSGRVPFVLKGSDSTAEIREILEKYNQEQFEQRQRIVALEKQREEILFAVSEGIQHVDRHENRIKATVRRARKELAEFGYEHPGLEAEAQELRLVDGGGSGEPQLPIVHEDVGVPQSSVPGVTQEQLRRVRGY